MSSIFPTLKTKYTTYRFLLTILLVVLGVTALKAQNNQFNIGGGGRQLRVTIYTNGNFFVERESAPNSGVWVNQFFTPTTPLFSIKIGATVFTSNQPTHFPTIGGDVVSIVGSRGEYSKTFSSTYSGRPFSVTIKAIYDTSNPSYFVLESTINASSITTGESISFAYGYDSYVNGCDGGAAWILPDLSGYNGVDASRNLTSTQVQGLRFVGGINNIGTGSLMGFFPVGRPFDRAYSAHYSNSYSPTIVNTTQNNLFKFGPAVVPSCAGGSNPWDNGVGVAYDNIPSGTTTTTTTGLTFDDSLDGTLDYLWNGVKNRTASVGSTATLNLIYDSFSPTALSGIAFRANFPGLSISSSCSMSGWLGGTSICTTGNNYYKLSGASITAAGTGTVNVPITVMQYGQWIINASSISETARTLPSGTPATLTAATGVNISSITSTQVCRGESSVVTVKLDGTNTTSQPITVAIDYTGSTATAADYTSRPTSVTIPVNDNQATFTIVTSPTATDGRTFNIRLASTDKAFATIGANVTGTVTIKQKPTLSSSTTIAAVCSGNPVSYTATGTLAGTSFSWTRAVVSGISNAAGSGSSATISETLTNTTTSPITVTYIYTLNAPNACTNTQNVTVVVNPGAALNSATTIPTVCSGSTVSYTATSTIGGTTFGWSRASVAGITPSTGSGSSATINETLTNTTSSSITVAYAYTLSVNGCTNTQNVTVVVKPKPTLSSVITIPAVCSGSPVNYTATSATSGTTFSWSRAAVAGISNSAGSGSSSGINETLTNTTANPVTVTYVFTLTANGCTNTQNVTVVVNPKPTLTSTLAPSAICNNTLFSYTATSATSGSTFSWARAVVSGISNSAGSGSTASISETLVNTTSAPVNVTYIYTLTANGCTNTQNVVVSIKPTPTLSSLLATGVCSNTSFSYTATSATSGTTFSWTRAVVSGISNSAGSGSSAVISETLVNTTGLPVNVTYVVSMSANGCTNTQNVVVTVSPRPTLSSTLTPSAVCSNSSFSYTATSAVVGATFTWTRAVVTGISNSAGSGSSGTINETLINTTSAPVNVTYAVTITASGCANNTQNVVVTVNPRPVLSSATTISAVCGGNPITYTATSATAGTTFSWSRATVTGITPTTGSGSSAAISETLTNTTASPITVTYVYTLTANGCTNTQNVTVVVNPRPVPTISGDASPCAGSRQTYTTETGMSAYAWTVTGGTIFSGQGTRSIVVDWGAAGSGNLTVAYTSASGCTTVTPTSQAITINTVPSPTVSGTFSVWQNSTWTYTTETGMNTYVWTVTGGTILSGQGTSSVSVKWTSGTSGTIKVSYRTPATCFADMTTPRTVTIGSAELTLSILATSIDEGSSSIGTICLPTSTSAPTGGIVVALARKASSTAVAADYTMPTSVTIPAGQQCVNFTIGATTDDLVEGSEQLDITATATGLTVAEASITINDRTLGDIMVEKFTPLLGADASESPLVHGSFRIHFKGANVKCTKGVKVFFTLSGTAVQGATKDYTTTMPTEATIASGSSWVDVPITVINNAMVQGNHDVVITLNSVALLP